MIKTVLLFIKIGLLVTAIIEKSFLRSPLLIQSFLNQFRLLCGYISEGHSIMLGSNQRGQCTNNCIVLIIVHKLLLKVYEAFYDEYEVRYGDKYLFLDWIFITSSCCLSTHWLCL